MRTELRLAGIKSLYPFSCYVGQKILLYFILNQIGRIDGCDKRKRVYNNLNLVIKAMRLGR